MRVIGPKKTQDALLEIQVRRKPPKPGRRLGLLKDSELTFWQRQFEGQPVPGFSKVVALLRSLKGLHWN